MSLRFSRIFLKNDLNKILSVKTHAKLHFQSLVVACTFRTPKRSEHTLPFWAVMTVALNLCPQSNEHGHFCCDCEQVS